MTFQTGAGTGIGIHWYWDSYFTVSCLSSAYHNILESKCVFIDFCDKMPTYHAYHENQTVCIFHFTWTRNISTFQGTLTLLPMVRNFQYQPVFDFIFVLKIRSKSKMVRKKSRLCQKVLIYRFQKSSSEALPVACRDCIQISGRQLIWLSPHVEKLKLNDESLPMHLDCETLAPPIDETKCLSAVAAVIPTREMNTLWNERL